MTARNTRDPKTDHLLTPENSALLLSTISPDWLRAPSRSAERR